MAFNPGEAAYHVTRMLGRPPRVQASLKPLSIGRTRFADGGIVDSPFEPFTGPIVSHTAGRADQVPMHVPTDSYVIPADIVSAIGQGNSVNGLAVLKKMFAPVPYGAASGPYGSTMPRGAHGAGVRGPSLGAPNAPGLPSPNALIGRFGYLPGMQSKGGAAHGAANVVPIDAAGGEFVVPPNHVARVGGGNVKRGHRVLDAWVKSMRKQTIDTLKKLPGPAK